LEFERKRRWVTVACTNCGKPVVRDSGQIFRKIRKRLGAFCSKLCQAQHFTGANHPVWRGGSDPNRGHDWRKRAERIRERDGYACRWCGKTQEQAGQKLSVDHVRPWREFEDKAEANDESNLVALCRKCHSKKGGLERKWLKGDGLALQEYRRMVGVSIKTIGPVDL
jgi:hypothetical protein